MLSFGNSVLTVILLHLERISHTTIELDQRSSKPIKGLLASHKLISRCTLQKTRWLFARHLDPWPTECGKSSRPLVRVPEMSEVYSFCRCTSQVSCYAPKIHPEFNPAALHTRKGSSSPTSRPPISGFVRKTIPTFPARWYSEILMPSMEDSQMNKTGKLKQFWAVLLLAS